MGYKDVLGIKEESVAYVFDKYTDNHFIERGFYYDTMSPRFMNEYGYGELDLGLPCLKSVTEHGDGGTLRVFINDRNAYVEVETPWRSYQDSDYHNFSHTNITVRDIEEVLDDLLEGYADGD